MKLFPVSAVCRAANISVQAYRNYIIRKIVAYYGDNPPEGGSRHVPLVGVYEAAFIAELTNLAISPTSAGQWFRDLINQHLIETVGKSSLEALAGIIYPLRAGTTIMPPTLPPIFTERDRSRPALLVIAQDEDAQFQRLAIARGYDELPHEIRSIKHPLTDSVPNGLIVINLTALFARVDEVLS